MPSFYSYGIHAFLELQDRSSKSNPKLSKLSESTSKIMWNPMQGMSHPILSTNVISPAKPGSPLPFCIVVEFDPDINRHRSNNLKGDVRIETKIDGVVSGWRVLPQAKIWPKGTRIEFSGLRVARTEEMAYMFNSPPRNSRKSSIEITNTTKILPTRNSEDPTLVPFAPSGLPLNTSHIEILITVGKKHNTLEKYLIFSPVLQEAFYIPPRSLSSKGSENSTGVSVQGARRKLGSKKSNKNEDSSTGEIIQPPHRPDAMEVDGQSRRTWDQNTYIPMGVDKEMNEWKPIGFASVSQKTSQMREAEFTASMHLARFWFIIYHEAVNLDRHKASITPIPSTLIDGQNVIDLAEILINKKTVQKRTLGDSVECDVATVGDSDTMVGRKQRVTKKRTSEIRETSPAIHRSEEDDKASGSEGVSSNMPMMQGIISTVQHQTGPKISKAHLDSESDDLKSRASRKKTKTTHKTLVSPSKPVISEQIGPNNPGGSGGHNIVLDYTKRVRNINKKIY